MLDVSIYKDEYYSVSITDGEKVFEMIFGGNLDLHWNLWSIDKIDKDKSISFDITKDSYALWELFDNLYNDFRDCNVSTVNEAELSFCEDSEEVRKIYERCNKRNEFLRKTTEYKRVFDGKIIKWLSDDESCNIVTITPDEDKYVIDFISGEKKISYLESHGISFRNSGSSNAPFNVLFMKLYNEIISGKYDFNQIHMNEYIRKLKKHS